MVVDEVTQSHSKMEMTQSFVALLHSRGELQFAVDVAGAAPPLALVFQSAVTLILCSQNNWPELVVSDLEALFDNITQSISRYWQENKMNSVDIILYDSGSSSHETANAKAQHIKHIIQAAIDVTEMEVSALKAFMEPTCRPTGKFKKPPFLYQLWNISSALRLYLIQQKVLAKETWALLYISLGLHTPKYMLSLRGYIVSQDVLICAYIIHT